MLVLLSNVKSASKLPEKSACNPPQTFFLAVYLCIPLFGQNRRKQVRVERNFFFLFSLPLFFSFSWEEKFSFVLLLANSTPLMEELSCSTHARDPFLPTYPHTHACKHFLLPHFCLIFWACRQLISDTLCSQPIFLIQYCTVLIKVHLAVKVYCSLECIKHSCFHSRILPPQVTSTAACPPSFSSGSDLINSVQFA